MHMTSDTLASRRRRHYCYAPASAVADPRPQPVPRRPVAPPLLLLLALLFLWSAGEAAARPALLPSGRRPPSSSSSFSSSLVAMGDAWPWYLASTNTSVSADCVSPCASGYVCFNGTCSNCTSSQQCSGTLACLTNSDGTSTCQRESIFPNFTWRDAVTTLILFMGATLAAGGGLGGGGIFVPILILVTGFTAQEAVAVSQAMIFGGAIINFIKNIRSHHPSDPSRPLIDFDATVILEPTLLLGTVIGVILNVVSPSWLISVLLVLLTSLMVYRTFKKGRVQWKKERRVGATTASGASGTSNGTSSGAAQRPVEPEHHQPVELQPVSSTLDGFRRSNTESSYSGAKSLNGLLTGSLSAVSIIAATPATKQQRKPPQPWRPALKPLGVVFIIWAVVLVFSIVRGGRAGTSSLVGVETCSSAYWGLTAGLFVLLLLTSALIAYFLSKRYHARISAENYTLAEGDVAWNTRNIVKFAVFSFLAGLVGSFLGLGGGMVIGPVLLEMGMHSQISSATSAMTVLITSSSAVLQYLLLHKLPLSHSGWYFAVGIISTFVGQTIISYLVNKYKRTSIVIFSITLMLAVAVVIMIVSGALSIVSDLKYGKSTGFTSFC